MHRRQFLQGAALAAAELGFTPNLLAQRPNQGPSAPLRRGVNLAGAEFGVRAGFSNRNPGQFGKDYTYNSERSVAYFAEHGISLIRVPFCWERMQPQLGMPLDAAELGRLKQFVGWAKQHKATVILDPHNYGRYHIERDGKVIDAIIDQQIAGTTPVTREHFADFWKRLSDEFRDEPTVEAYGLINEPHDMGPSDWKAISQAAVDAIRANNDRKPILVPGNSWSNAERFAQFNGPKAWINDPADNVLYEAHCYFDADSSGRYNQSYQAEAAKDKDLEHRGVRRLKGFIQWCQANRVRGFLGEFGVPNDPGWLRVLEHFLTALDQAGMEGCWWAAGEWWGDYKLSLQPHDDFQHPAPQMAVYRNRASR
jgi:endoglucanase